MYKKFYVLIAMVLLIAGCGSSEEGNKKKEENEPEITYDDWNELAEEFDDNREGTLTIETKNIVDGQEFENQIITYSEGSIAVEDMLEGNEGSYECDVEVDGSIYKSEITSASGSYDEERADNSCTIDYINTTNGHVGFSAVGVYDVLHNGSDFEITNEEFSDEGDFIMYYVESEADSFDNAVFKVSVYKEEFKVVVELKFDDKNSTVYTYEWK